MPEHDAITAMVQLGAAGVIGWLWLAERRGAQERDAQLRAAHERLTQERLGVDALLGAVRENTRVLAQLEGGQRALVQTLHALLGERAQRARGAKRGPEAPGSEGQARRAG